MTSASLLFVLLALSAQTPVFPTLPADAPIGAGVTQACQVGGPVGSARCGVFRVPEDRDSSNAGGRTLDIVFVVLEALEPGNRVDDAIIVLPGGPGSALTPSAAPMSRQLAELRSTRDVVLPDVRGVGRSGSLSCPVPYPGGLTSRFETPFPADHAALCRDELSADAALDRYTTAATVDDLEELRKWLGYSSFNLLGTSYGTRVAQIYMRRHQESVRTAVLNGVAPVAEPLYVQHAFLLQRALERLLVECREDAACHTAYPALEDRLETLLEEVGRTPVEVRVGSDVVPFGRGALAYALRGLLYGRAGELPGLIHRAAEGDLVPLAEYYRERTDRFGAPDGNIGYHFSVLCAEDIAPLTEEWVAAATGGTFMGDHLIESYRAVCRVWPHAALSADHWTPVRSAAPTLLLSGGRDPVTPPEAADAVAEHLPHSLHVVVPNGGHGVGGPCIQRMIDRLVITGSVEGLDVSCVDAAPPTRFRP